MNFVRYPWDRTGTGKLLFLCGSTRKFSLQGGVNIFNDYADDSPGERVLKSGRAGFIGWLGFGGSVIMWRPDLNIGFGYACTLLTWWDLANTKESAI